MKKFYAFAAAAMMAATAFAQNGAPLYATGAGQFEGGEWAPTAASEFAYVDGVYTLEVAGLSQFKISTVLGDWPEFNGGALTCNYGEEQGVAVALEPGDANIACPWQGDYTITVAGDLSTITLTTETPAPTGPTVLYLRGGMNGWGAEAEWAFSQVSSNVYKFVFAEGQEIPVGEAFKVADATWGAQGFNFGGGGEALLLETDTQVFNGSNDNMTLDEACSGVVWFVNNLDGTDESYVWFSNDKDAAPDWAPEPDSWGVVGGFNGWGNDVKMTEKEAGVWTVTIDQLEGEFKFRKNGEWADNYGTAGESGNIAASGEYGIAAGGNNFNIAAVENVTLTLDINRGILVVETESLSGVADIEAVDAPARYFNLQGVEVANPSNGVYIVVKGNKASKAVVK